MVIDNFSARVMRNWGMDYDSIKEIKPDIIAVSMSGFGHTGPHKDYVSYGPTLQALSGYTLLMRHAGKEPAGWGYSYADMSGGYSGALAVLMALWHRRRTGEGQFVDLSQFETISSIVGPALLDISANGRALGRWATGLRRPRPRRTASIAAWETTAGAPSPCSPKTSGRPCVGCWAIRPGPARNALPASTPVLKTRTS